MKKKIGTVLSFLAFTATACSLAATALTEKTASAADVADTLVVPASYEEYLSLNAPSDTAVCEDYTAIADGNAVYLFDRADGVYRKYEHTLNTDEAKNKVTKLQFDENDNLYFLDASTYLYRLNETTFDELESATATQTGFACSAFLIEGEVLYFTNVTTETQLSKVPLSSPDIHAATTLVNGLHSKPTLAFFEGELYYTDSGKYLNKINPDEANPKQTPVAAFASEIVSMTIEKGAFACADIDGQFFVYDLTAFSEQWQASALTPVCFQADDYSAVSAFDGKLYAVNGAVVKQFDIESAAFTTYEICASSAANNRLHDAKELFLSGSTLYIADGGNGRISVYDTATGTFRAPFATTLAPTFLCADESTLLAANAETASLYDLTSGEVIDTFDAFHGSVKGAVNVYGTYYLVTDGNYFYSLTKTESGEWTRTETKKSSTRYPKHLAADAYGSLYVGAGSELYRFDEAQFLSPNDTGERLLGTLPAGTQKIAVDYERSVYALADSSVYKIGESTNEAFAFHLPQVYADGVSVTSFAFGIEENQTYILCDGNYMLCSARLSLPTVKTIAVDGADEEVFGETSAAFAVVQTQPNALLVEFEIQSLKGAQYFPYLAVRRQSVPVTALKIGQAGEYALLAVFDRESNSYSTYLAQSRFCTALPSENYRTEYAENQRKTGYLTNAIALYKFPYLTELLTAGTLPKDGQVTLLGEITELDYPYYQVSFKDENGVEKTGYIPQSYVAAFDGLPPASESVFLGETESNQSSEWRFAYLVLGFAAVCILTDYLLVRKKDDKE